MTTSQRLLLLTGADGFTGRHLEAAALAAGYAVHRLQANLTDADAVRLEVEAANADVVIHLAAISAVTHSDEFAFYSVNVFGTQNLFSALAGQQHKPTAVLLASSANVYGNCAVSPVAEGVTPEPVNHYALSKLACEGVARMFSDRLPIQIIRPFNYTGVGHDDRFVIPKIVNAYRVRQPVLKLGTVSVEREYNDVRFVVDTYLQLLQRGVAGQIYNLCSGITYSLTQVLQTMNELTGHAPQIELDSTFVRTNELQRLCGSPSKLATVTEARVANELRALLRWMLEAGNAQTSAAR
jgi:GDP-6-deoxy-D-talose 4-dehydrogenase